MVQAYDFNSTTLINGNYYVKNYLDDKLTGNLRGTDMTTLTLTNGTAYAGKSALLSGPIDFSSVKYVTNSGVTITFRFMMNTKWKPDGTDGYLSIFSAMFVPCATGANGKTQFLFYPTLFTSPNAAAGNRRHYFYVDVTNGVASSAESGYANMVLDVGKWCFIAITIGRKTDGTMDNRTVLMFSDVITDSKVGTNSTSAVGSSGITTSKVAIATCSQDFTNGGNIVTNGAGSGYIGINNVAQSNGGNGNSVGVIDDFRVYQRALTVSELQFEYTHTYTA